MKTLLLLAAIAAAPMAADPRAEARAQALENEIRCVVCQNEPISQSTADIAEDMRRLVRERIAAGDSDSEIRAYFQARYGEFVLLRPGFNPSTWLLWGAPLLIAAAGAWAVLGLRGGGKPETGEISPEDR